MPNEIGFLSGILSHTCAFLQIILCFVLLSQVLWESSTVYKQCFVDICNRKTFLEVLI